MHKHPYSDLHLNSYHIISSNIHIFTFGIRSFFLMKELERIRTSYNSLKCLHKTQVKLTKGILFLSYIQKNRDLASEKNPCHYNLIDEMIGAIE